MARRLAIASQKGGVGKTTIALNLAVALAERGRRTLLVDLDPQGGIGLSLARGDTDLPGLAELLMGLAPADQVVSPTKLSGLSLVPRGRLDPADACEFEQALYSPGVLEGALDRIEGDSEIVIIDTPSGMGLVTRAALVVSDFVLLPFQTESLAMRSVHQALHVINHVRERENPRLRLIGIVPTLVDKSKPGTTAILSELWTGFPGLVETFVPRADAFIQASVRGVPVSFLAGTSSPEARRFEILAVELDSRMSRLAGVEKIDEAQEPRQLL
jgi:chromosome partitioning protein